jgi:chorismate mutase
MATVEEIPIQVPSAVAAAYRSATETERLQIAARIGLMLKVATGSKPDAVDRLKQTMNDISSEAEANGLTPEILESILNDQ